ncbi:hypothetical protein V6N11_025882 [Hibiscus sabdariffa]|uniref:Uncharacterized protein n=1 Tax=Hibiscus sabdariffa TaxID=183260 RepID=A0ABR2SU04_9ROSI
MNAWERARERLTKQLGGYCGGFPTFATPLHVICKKRWLQLSFDGWIQGNGNYQWNSVKMILKLGLRV